MANEGSTKATYEELESDVRRWKDASDANRDEAMRQQDGKLLWKQRHDRLLADYKTSEDSLARVRGLLQRQWVSVEERLPEKYHTVVLVWQGVGLITGFLSEDGTWRTHDNATKRRAGITHWQPIEPPTFPQSSSLVPQGAESADIGKLDSANKSGNYMTEQSSVDIGKAVYRALQLVEYAEMTDSQRDTEKCRIIAAAINDARYSGVEMGKVNRVDECDCGPSATAHNASCPTITGKVRRCGHSWSGIIVCELSSGHQGEHWTSHDGGFSFGNKAGSAETGGEKA